MQRLFFPNLVLHSRFCILSDLYHLVPAVDLHESVGGAKQAAM